MSTSRLANRMYDSLSGSDVGSGELKWQRLYKFSLGKSGGVFKASSGLALPGQMRH
jgi:hypothetical protein